GVQTCALPIYLRGRERGIPCEHECRGSGGMGCRGRGTEEPARGWTARKPAGIRDADPVEGDDVRLRARLRRREKDARRTLRAVRLDGGECGVGDVDRADGDRVAQRRLPDDAARRRDVLLPERAETEELQQAALTGRLYDAELEDPSGRRGVEDGQLLEGI